jgi:hypothetical protein
MTPLPVSVPCGYGRGFGYVDGNGTLQQIFRFLAIG